MRWMRKIIIYNGEEIFIEDFDSLHFYSHIEKIDTSKTASFESPPTREVMTNYCISMRVSGKYTKMIFKSLIPEIRDKKLKKLKAEISANYKMISILVNLEEE